MAAYSFSSLRELLRDQESPIPNVFEGFPSLPLVYSDSESSLKEEEESLNDETKDSILAAFNDAKDDGPGGGAAADAKGKKDAMKGEGEKKKERGYVYAKFDENIGKYVVDEGDVPFPMVKQGPGYLKGCVKLYLASPDDDEEIGGDDDDQEEYGAIDEKLQVVENPAAEL